MVSGANTRQVRAITDNVEEQLSAQANVKPKSIEGIDTFTWVLMDFGFLIVHIFTDESREFYDLDRLWSDVPQLSPTSS